MLAVHFGAGNIGRGFIGSLLHRAGYEVAFVDVNEDVIHAIQTRGQYRVIFAGENQEEEVIDQISAINSSTNPEKVEQAVAEADLVTTAVGPNVLPVIAKAIASGLTQRFQQTEEPLNVIACENMVGGSSVLKDEVYKHVTAEEQALIAQRVGFPDSAVDRIVPNQKQDDPLAVAVEPYYEWVVEQPAIRGEVPDVPGITYVDELKPFIERKLFTVNTGHATIAYAGRYYGYQTIKEALEAEEVYALVKGVLDETGKVLVTTYGFEPKEHKDYQAKILERFRNPYISDEVTRVGRGPIRKLGNQDRFVRPALLYREVFNETPNYVAKAIAVALLYKNAEDQEAVDLENKINQQGFASGFAEIAALEEDHPLVKEVVKQVQSL
ncbi:mannitol-1-phosphate 5-dehydrogenase [Gracilibacillus halophilus YIM-C55.5]|uniref:Mannitol-1-phosphate 5-dehydrogenase n=1 Tax=Gracilibacillus halophilus YIM-C55.5 TaxID=1308866 RepID=N4WYQ0_9BACI|nr:mannitol-1-phosphate 5-dehydrogenase [Gracilibacillus halophilus]ENH98171.1 mannitol-1-phosphate 5-dehydrogenase [Gracilibacillus halophilus YIM-C55.5]